MIADEVATLQAALAHAEARVTYYETISSVLKRQLQSIESASPETDPASEKPDPEPAPGQPDHLLTATAATLSEARKAYLARHGSRAPDCDMNADGTWTCYSEPVSFGVPQTESLTESDQPSTPATSEPSGRAGVFNVPGKADNAYKYNTNGKSNLTTYADADGNLKQVLAYYNADRQACIVVRDFPSGEFGSPINIHRQLGNDELEYDNHNCTAVGVAPDGKVFVAANMHVDPLRMAVTSKPYDLNSFVGFDREQFPGSDTDRVTYPSFFHHNGYLCISYREQEAGGGVARFRWILKRYNHNSGGWESLASINNGNNLRLYVSNIAASQDGKRIHFAALWRDDNPKHAQLGTQHQHDYFHMYSDNGKDWYQYSESGAKFVALPINWTAEGKSNVPVNIWTTPPDPTPNNAGSITVDAQGNPHMLMNARGGDLYYHTHKGKWLARKGILDTGDEHIFSSGDDIYAVSNSGESIYLHKISGESATTKLIARGFVNSAFSVSIDVAAIQHGHLSLMMTKCKSQSPRSSKAKYTTDMHVLSLPLSELSSPQFQPITR